MSAQLNLANALAQQAAGRPARRNSAPPSSGAPAHWQPLRLGRDFRVHHATQKALVQVAAAMNKTLRPEGLVVNIVADVPQPRSERPVFVAEARGGKLVKAYDEAEFLTVFARQRQVNGVIVDGQA